MKSDIVVGISGRAGAGVVSAGEILARVLSRRGFFVHTYESYGPAIRTGASFYQFRFSLEPVYAPGERLDLLIALDQDYLPFLPLVKEGGLVLGEGVKGGDSYRALSLPLSQLLEEVGARAGVRNMVAVGVAGALLGLPQRLLEWEVGRKFGEKAWGNLAPLLAGYSRGRRLEPLPGPQPGEEHGLLFMSGNEALALGALAADCQVFAGYPITPATEILEFLAQELPRRGGVVFQAEDEMASLAFALGASYAGKRALTATSGPGLSLMVELANLAAMAEVPVVIVDVQRAGPSTGLPTKPEQGDLDLAIFGASGESPRVVLAPTSVEDCFYAMPRAFNLAEKYQLPVLVLSDFYLARAKAGFPKPDLAGLEPTPRLAPSPAELQGYRRFRITPSGVSPISTPGKPGVYGTTGLEHDEAGAPSVEPEVHRTMVAKRQRKVESAAGELQDVVVFGSPAPELGIIGWGSTQGAVREAVSLAREEGIAVAALYPLALHPLPVEVISSFARPLRRLLVPELNHSGQLARLLRMRCGLNPVSLPLCEGRHFLPSEILTALRQIAHDKTAVRL